MPVYPGDPETHVERVQQLSRGDVCNLSRLDLSAHAGTHVDAPVHFIDGAAAVDELPLDRLVGTLFVADLTTIAGDITVADLLAAAVPESCRRLFLKTPNSALWAQDVFSEDFVGLTADAAHHLVDRGIEVVGIDYLSIAPFGDPAPTHRTLLAAGVLIVEGLDFRDVAPGWYDYLCLPIRIAGADGAPARVLLRPA